MNLVMEILFEFFVSFIIPLLINWLGEILWGIEKRLVRRPDRSYGLGVVGLFISGCIVGALSSVIWPKQLLHPGLFPGISLIVSPLLVGLVMWFYGNCRRDNGKPATRISTFGGGAALAFGFALVRYIWIR